MIKENQGLQSSEELVKQDITILVAECRSWAGALYRRVSRKDGDISSVYNNFIEHFFQLYTSLKYNFKETSRILDWEEKQKFYDAYFYDYLMNNPPEPLKAIMLFDKFLEDTISCGIFNLGTGEFVDKRDN